MWPIQKVSFSVQGYCDLTFLRAGWEEGPILAPRELGVGSEEIKETQKVSDVSQVRVKGRTRTSFWAPRDTGVGSEETKQTEKVSDVSRVRV